MHRQQLLVLLLAAVASVAAGCGSKSSSQSSSTAASAGSGTASSQGAATVGFEGVPLEQGPDLAPASTTQTGPVNGIQCGPTEQLAYHIHAHLAVYANGQPRALSAGIGIPGSTVQPSPQGPLAAGGQCIYWLHTHTGDGVIHIESPTQRIYTVGDFFDVWHQPLSANQVAGERGPVTAFLNGKRWSRDPRSIPLLPHGVIQFDIGSPTPPFQGMSWSATQL